MTSITHYEVLKIESNASADEIKRAYYKLVRQFPPERFPDEFRTIREAYDILSDPEKRSQYDKELEKQKKLAGELPAEAIEEIERIKTEMQRAHTGNAVKAAESLFAQYPSNAAVLKLLVQAYLRRGWTNKAMEYLLSREYQNTLKTVQDWEEYNFALELVGVNQKIIFIKNIEGVSILSENGDDNIDMCAWAYYTFSQFSKSEIPEYILPEKFNTPDKILNYILILSERGLKSKDSDSLISNILMPIIEHKKPSEINSNDMDRLKIILEIIQNAVDAQERRKSQFKQFIETIEYMIWQQSEPEYRLEPVRVGEKIGRNAPCPCGSGKKYKKCCAR